MEKIKLFFSNIWDFIRPFVIILLSKSGTILASAAISAVTATAQCATGATDEEKRNAAFKLIVEDLKKQGVQVGVEITTSMINAAIELAVQKKKSE